MNNACNFQLIYSLSGHPRPEPKIYQLSLLPWLVLTQSSLVNFLNLFDWIGIFGAAATTHWPAGWLTLYGATASPPSAAPQLRERERQCRSTNLEIPRADFHHHQPLHSSPSQADNEINFTKMERNAVETLQPKSSHTGAAWFQILFPFCQRHVILCNIYLFLLFITTDFFFKNSALMLELVQIKNEMFV